MKRFLLCLFILFSANAALAQTATPITFEGDRTSAMVAGKVPEGSMQVFTLEAWQNAAVGFYLMSAERNADFEVMDPNNNLVAKGSPDKFGAQEWKGQLGRAGTYTVVVFSTAGLADFQLTVTMP